MPPRKRGWGRANRPWSTEVRRHSLYLPSPLLTKEGKDGARIVSELLNTYKDEKAQKEKKESAMRWRRYEDERERAQKDWILDY